MLEEISGKSDYNDYVQMAVDIAHYHHENWDGSGYPQGLAGKDIPLAAQIVSLIGDYCALTEKRSYRQAYGEEQALAMMQTEVGKKFNPDIFAICKKIARQLH